MSQAHDENEQSETPFVVTCPDCEVSKSVDRPNGAIEFARRHHSLTGHEVEWERADLDPDDVGDVPTDGDLKEVMWQLDEQYDDGIPTGIVTAVRSKQGVSMYETFDEVEELRMSGGLYEPRDDHLRPV
ncbi:hypothetical protein SAMN04487948_105360 [Halogranum amylolyticum]|uniref:Uncharacterized protein n=1 Tax=Halogranum amylolyticum TaxID=660520 RepID=A0A1H8SWH3_9EURY|nr:hypothetical protein [Halogranum amylolyticum]SEO82875.1 hypothetical protein SAMN04487948_105360 [Halogranum amylolyticum]